MKVRSVAHIFEQGVKARPEDVLDIHDALAEDFLRRGIVVVVRESSGVEQAILDGAPETTLGRRARGRSRAVPPKID